jgi:hypothetical protein
MAFGGRLSKANRWVKLADMIPWDEVEKRYAEQFTSTVGNPAYPVRVAFGALTIKEKLKITDEETAQADSGESLPAILHRIQGLQRETAFQFKYYGLFSDTLVGGYPERNQRIDSRKSGTRKTRSRK